MLAATIVAPGHNRVVPLEPEFIVPQDGHEKQDCESRAARRWLAAHGARYGRLKAVFLGDDLFSRQPICQAVLDVGGHFLFVCKPDSHKAIEEFRAGIRLDERIDRVRRGKKWFVHSYQWLPGVPLRGDEKAITVNWLSIEISDPDGAVTYRNSFITDLDVSRENVAAQGSVHPSPHGIVAKVKGCEPIESTCPLPRPDVQISRIRLSHAPLDLRSRKENPPHRREDQAEQLHVPTSARRCSA